MGGVTSGERYFRASELRWDEGEMEEEEEEG